MEIELGKLAIVKTIYPSNANFLLVEVENADSLYGKLLAEKIVIRNRSNQVKNCVRITIGTTEENQQLLNALKKLQSWKKYFLLTEMELWL